MASLLDQIASPIPLKRYGYQVVRHRRPDDFLGVKEKFRKFLKHHLETFSGRTLENFTLETYHQVLADHQIDHHAFIQKTKRNLPKDWLTDDPYIAALLADASALTGLPLRFYNDYLEFRVCRPSCGDNNPWHRDHWFPYFEPLLNIYLPLAGSYCDSALQVVPFSHEWTDTDVLPTFGYAEAKTSKNGVLYSVPEIKYSKFEIKGHRPDVVPGDFMLFSPKCVHGAGDNSSTQTRFSFEFRLEVGGTSDG